MAASKILSLVLLGLVGQSDALCGHYTDCYSCAKSCNWCARDNQCHSPVWVNFIDPCHRRWTGKDISEASKCPVQPPTTEEGLPVANNTFAKSVLTFVFKHLNITDVDFDTCLSDIGNSEIHLQDFGIDMKHKRYRSGLANLGRGVSALANSVSGCDLKEIRHRIDSLASNIHFANISAGTFDKATTAIIGASDMWKDVDAVRSAVVSKDANAIGDSLGKMLDDFSSVEGGCKAHGGAVCKVVDGLLRVAAVTAKDITACEQALEPAVDALRRGGEQLKAKDFNVAVADFSSGLDILAKATSSDACGLSHIANTIGKLSPKLASAVVKAKKGKPVQILVGAADVYDELYTMAIDFEKKDYTGVGAQLGLLLAKLKTTKCKTPMCIVTQGLLGSLQVGFTDLDACHKGLDKTWKQMQSLLKELEKKQWKKSILALGQTIKALGDDVESCGVKPIGEILQSTSEQVFYGSTFAADLGKVTQFFVSGADVTPDIQKILADATNERWSSLGSDLGVLSSFITSKDCNSLTCKITEGILEQAGMVLTDLKPCEDSLKVAEQDFINGAELWGKDDHKHALGYWSSGLKQIAKSVDACGLPSELKFIEQESNVLSLSNASGVGKALSILVHGNDMAEDISAAVEAFQKQDYRKAGSMLQKTLTEMFGWTTGHLCTKNACYILSGVLQYLNDLSKDMKMCKNDFVDMVHQFHSAYEHFTQGAKHHGPFKGFSHNKTAIIAGVHEVGHAFKDLAKGVADCHLLELAEVLEKLAVKLGIVPEVAVVETVLKILIDGISIERDIANGIEAFHHKNWPAFGYNLIKLTKDLLKVAPIMLKQESLVVV